MEKFGNLLADIRHTQLYKKINFLMNNNRTKTINGKKPFYYKDIIDYIKTQNKKITQIKPETKTTKIYYNNTQNKIK